MRKHQCVFKEKMDELLEDKGVSMQKMSNETGIAYSRMVSWRFKGSPQVCWEMLRAAEYFKVPLTYLLYGLWDAPYSPDKGSIVSQV